ESGRRSGRPGNRFPVWERSAESGLGSWRGYQHCDGRADVDIGKYSNGDPHPYADDYEHCGTERASPDGGAGARKQLWLVDGDVQLDRREWGEPVLAICGDDGGRERSVFAVDRDEAERDGERAADDGAGVRAVVVAGRGRLAVCRLQLWARGSDTSTDWHADADGDADIVGHGGSDASAFEH